METESPRSRILKIDLHLVPLPTLDLPNTQIFSEMREEDGQIAGPLCTSGTTLENAPVQCKSTIRKKFGKEPHRFRDQLYV